MDLKLERLHLASVPTKVVSSHKGQKVISESDESDEDDNGELDDLEVMKAKMRVKKYCNHLEDKIKGEEGEFL